MVLAVKRIPLLVAALLGMSLLLPLQAQAVEPSSDNEKDGHKVITTTEVQKTRDYWTPEKMENAEDTTIESSPNQRQISKSVGRAERPEFPVEVIAEPIGALPWDDPWIDPPIVELPANASATNGRIFSRGPSTRPETLGQIVDKVCSASAVNSSSKQVIATAGHCLFTGGEEGTYHEYITFIPGYYVDEAGRDQHPFHSYPATSLNITNAWLEDGDHRGDFAFVSTDKNPLGQKVVEQVGGHGIKIGGSYDFDTHMFGYPGTLADPIPYDGTVQRQCTGRTNASEPYVSQFFYALANCDHTGGSSGGPWLESYSASTGLGYIRSVLSFTFDVSNELHYAPYLDQRVTELLKQADEHKNPWD